MECLEENVGISNKICSLVTPLSVSLNMGGCALFAYIACIFLTMIYGVSLSFNMYVGLIFLTLFASMGISGIPSAALIVVLILIKSFGLPVSAIAILLGIDRVIDMFRTTINVFTGSCSAVLIAKFEGEHFLTKKVVIDNTLK